MCVSRLRIFWPSEMGHNIFKKLGNVSIFLTIMIIYCTADSVRAWDAEDFEVFDLVEEVGKNFYEVLGVSKDASQSTIRKAYHRLSLQLHPDHNKEENAEHFFRQLVGVYEVLKDEAKRQKYDQVLTDGLPDWRQPIFYYRRVRKFGLVELGVFLFGILTLGQYIVAWSVYLERKYEMEEVFGSKLKKKDKKLKKGKTADVDDPVKSRIREEICQIPKPRYQDLLPFLIVRGLVISALTVPSLCASFCKLCLDFRARRRQATLSAAAAAASDHSDGDGDDNHDDVNERVTKSRRRRVYEIPEFTPGENSATRKESTSAEVKELEDVDSEVIIYENRTWFDDDIGALTRAMVKYPVGTVGRWDVIAELLQRQRDDVISMAKTVNKLNAGSKPVSDSIQGLSTSTVVGVNGHEQEAGDEEQRKMETKGEGGWSSIQQKALEMALLAFPKGADDRWEKIGNCVPDKTKDECIIRYKYLVEMVKKRRQKDDR